MDVHIQFEQEEDGRWIAEALDLPGIMAYGATPKEAASKVQAIILHHLAESLAAGELPPFHDHITFSTQPHDLLAVG